MDDVHVLHFHSDALPALAFALKSAIDDLEARAIISETWGDDRGLGRDSAAEYRADIPRLMALLSQLDGFEVTDPRPDGHALDWLGNLYLIRDGSPVRVGPTEAFEELLAVALRRSTSGHVSGVELAGALARSTGEGRDELVERARGRHLSLGDSSDNRVLHLFAAGRAASPSGRRLADDSHRPLS